MSESKPLALISVYDKSNLAPLAKDLVVLGYQILSTGGTARYLKDHDIPYREVAEYTGNPEILGGRVKTLHPKIHGGILWNPALAREDQDQPGLNPISLVVVNLYPFEKEAGKNPDPETAIEWIDIGGPAMLRAAAKNWQHCLPVVDPHDYPEISEALKTEMSREFRLRHAQKTFALTSAYDSLIANTFSSWLGDESPDFPEAAISLRLERRELLRYGENPHQKAGFYSIASSASFRTPDETIQLHGKPLSYNNLLDSHAASALVRSLPLHQGPAVAIIKHTNPCGCAQKKAPLSEVFALALQGDPRSAFGGIVALNCPVDAGTATLISESFFECVIAPDFSPGSLEVLKQKKNLRLLRAPWISADPSPHPEMRSAFGGILLQQSDNSFEDPGNWKTVTRKTPDHFMLADMEFAMRVASHVKSNAIVLASHGQVKGVGAGQMSRIDALECALRGLRQQEHNPEGTVLASDAFFPFKDCVILAAENGIRGIVQPGGSVRDQESIEAADSLGISMVFTGVRHFRH